MAPTELCGDPVATRIREVVDERVRALDEEGVTPALGTVMATDAPGAAKYMDLKHEACADHGIATRDHRLAPDASRSVVFEAVEALSEDEAVDAGSARRKADAFTPVPGGVGPVTLAALLDNVVTAAERRAASAPDRPPT